MTQENRPPKQTLITALQTPILPYSVLLAAAFGVCAAIGMLINSQAFYKLFFVPSEVPVFAGRSQSYYWDISAYAAMALKSTCTAFYPLWSLLIRVLFHPQTQAEAARGFQVSAIALFFSSLPLLVSVFQSSIQDRVLAFVVASAYVLSPLAIFRVIGYTEGLFGVLSLGFLWALSSNPKSRPWMPMVVLCAVTTLMSLTRPIMVQMIGAIVAAIATIFGFEWLKSPIGGPALLRQLWDKYARIITIAVLTSISAFVGYAVYGLFCLQSRGNFFAPFQDQSLWKKSIGFRPDLLLFPKSPLVDLLALYLPLLIWVVGLAVAYANIKSAEWFVPRSPLWWMLCAYPPLFILIYLAAAQRKRPSQIPQTELGLALSENYLFWFCVYFALAHSVISFLTQDRLVSLGRYVFALPFIFLAIGILLECFPSQKRYSLSLGLSGVSALLLVQQWINYGYHNWLG